MKSISNRAASGILNSRANCTMRKQSKKGDVITTYRSGAKAETHIAVLAHNEPVRNRKYQAAPKYGIPLPDASSES